MQGFTFHRHTLGQLLRMDVDLIFNPENPRDPNCQDFIADFITSGKSLAVSLTVRDIVIRLAGFSITMNPRRKVDTTVLGINARFVKFIRLYPSVFGVLFGNNCNFSFNFGELPLLAQPQPAEVIRKSGRHQSHNPSYPRYN